MKPTSNLRWVERKEEMSPFYKSFDGGPAFRTYLVLQQWWSLNPEIEIDWICKVNGEWRDVEIEKETENV
jgi:hypothetical protein